MTQEGNAPSIRRPGRIAVAGGRAVGELPFATAVDVHHVDVRIAVHPVRELLSVWRPCGRRIAGNCQRFRPGSARIDDVDPAGRLTSHHDGLADEDDPRALRSGCDSWPL